MTIKTLLKQLRDDAATEQRLATAYEDAEKKYVSNNDIDGAVRCGQFAKKHRDMSVRLYITIEEIEKRLR